MLTWTCAGVDGCRFGTGAFGVEFAYWRLWFMFGLCMWNENTLKHNAFSNTAMSDYGYMDFIVIRDIKALQHIFSAGTPFTPCCAPYMPELSYSHTCLLSPSFPPDDYAPSLPNSAVHSSLLLISSCDTVGLDPLIAFSKSFLSKGGSRSCSLSTSVHVISSAPGSPGEHGVSFSSPSTVTCK